MLTNNGAGARNGVGVSSSTKDDTRLDNEFGFASFVTSCTCGKEVIRGVETGKNSCCGEGGSWFQKCKKYNQGEIRLPNFPHSWQEGKQACPGKIVLHLIFTQVFVLFFATCRSSITISFDMPALEDVRLDVARGSNGESSS